MLLTEQEAKTKVCCRETKPVIPPYWQSGTIAYCIASECMAWRWYYKGLAKLNTNGYCGLGGNP
jgi:hypothetical protein